MGEYRSFREQSAHYFQRAHTSPALAAVGGPANWRSSDLADKAAYRFELSGEDRHEIEVALERARRAEKPRLELGAEDFPLPSLGEKIAGFRRELSEGRGFQLISGVPVERWSQDDAELFFWCFGLHLGNPGAQNPRGDLVGHVRDDGSAENDPFIRLYQTNANIAYHCDAADVVGLLCLARSKSGGASRIASSVAVYNALLAKNERLAMRLFEPFQLDVRDAKPTDPLRHLPIPPCRFDGGRLRTFYHSDYFRSVERHDDIPRLTALEREVLDTYDEIARDPELFLDMELAPGDVQLLSNHTVIHGRTAFEDGGRPEQKRHLLRLWLSLEDRG